DGELRGTASERTNGGHWIAEGFKQQRAPVLFERTDGNAGVRNRLIVRIELRCIADAQERKGTAEIGGRIVGRGSVDPPHAEAYGVGAVNVCGNVLEVRASVLVVLVAHLISAGIECAIHVDGWECCVAVLETIRGGV